MDEVNTSIIHELGHACMGVLEDVPVLRIEYDRPNGMWVTTFGKKMIVKGIEDYLMARLFLSGPATETLVFGEYDTETCGLDEEKAFGIFLEKKLTFIEHKDIDIDHIMAEIFNECYMRLAPFYRDFLELEPIYRYHLIIADEDLREILDTFRRRKNGLPSVYGSERAGDNHSTITEIRKEKTGAGTR